ncbi:MAG TPA: radical SAM protein [Candidatus Nanoarchaeia archaeon]|nr:radical SAM protein [Candidatus Nanoarchaeia archaeon]
MNVTILDCYTDEPSGLGVPPSLGTYPRYMAGSFEGKVTYLTIDDLRLYKKYSMKQLEPKISQKTNISVHNLTKNIRDIKEILDKTDTMYVILGVHVPGKYLSATPGTLSEVIPMISDIKCEKILTGPAVFGTQLFGGKFAEKIDLKVFDRAENINEDYAKIAIDAVSGAQILKQIPDLRVIEIETARGCRFGKCSFCLEPIKHKLEFRERRDIVREMKACYDLGARYFRLGKQSSFFSYPEMEELFKDIWRECPGIKVLHIDNVDPVEVTEDKTKIVAKYCTEGNIAAFGIESFDEEVVKENTLNSSPNVSYRAIKIINKYGKERGENGMPRFLPGINILFGLKGESKKTHEENMKWLQMLLDEELWFRRINIRQVALFEGTKLYQDAGDKFLRKNRKYYWKWRNEIRHKIDLPMLQKLVPKGAILRDVRAEIYDGNTTFARQVGTYPLIVGIKGRLPLKQFYTIKITGHMLRSVTGEVVE